MKFNRQYVFGAALATIVLLALFLRFYQFEPWLHFELDQARDARVIDEAFAGSFLDLPLLGPKAGGTFLRLAPGFYYMQYGSGLIFGQSPAGIAFFVAVFGVLFLGALYVFLRRGFGSGESLALVALATVSVYLVLYSRFAWNPNLLPFFLVAGFYALLRAVDKNEQHQERWFLAAVFLLTLATHFHFLAFLAVPVITIGFLVLRREWFSWRAWALGLLIVCTLYFPVILNEIETGGLNTQEFFGAITEKSTKEERNLAEKTVRNISEFGLHSIVILSGFEGATFPSVLINDKEWGTVCDAKCDKGKWYGVAGVIFFVLGVFSLIVGWWRAENRQISDFYLLSLVWLGVSFMLYLPLAYGVAPRFYLLTAPLFFVMLGSIFVNLFPQKFKQRPLLFFSAAILLIGTNLYFLEHRFDELRQAGVVDVQSAPDRILKERARVTLEQQNTIVSYLKERQGKSGYPVYMYSEPQHRRALKYLMEQAGIQNDVLGFSGIYKEGEYYLILRSAENLEDRLEKYLNTYHLIGIKPFGTLSVVELYPKDEFIQGVRQDFTIVEKKADSKAPPRYTWREFFERQQTENGEDADDFEDEQAL